MTEGAGHLADLLSAMVDGELAAADATAARAHLVACNACQAELAATEHVRDLVRDLPAVDPPVPLGAGRAPVTGRLVGMVAAVAAAVALVLLPRVGEEEPAPPVGRLVEVHTTSVVNSDPVSQLTPGALSVSLR